MKGLVIRAGVAIVASVTLFTVSAGAAGWRRVVPLFDCRPTSGSIGLDSAGGTAITIQNGPSQWGTVKCGFPEDDDVNGSAVTWINVATVRSSPYYGSADPYQKVNACVGYWDNIGGYCGATTSKTGWTVAHPDLTAWNAGNGLPYVSIRGMTGDTILSISAGF